MNMNSPMILFAPELCPIPIVFPVSKYIEAARSWSTCMNCRHFHQLEDWREVPAGFYCPKGECQCHAPGADGFPKVHGGQKCGDFVRNEQEN